MPNCSICGEPMGPHEKMFKFHGSDGNDCPKPPLVKRTLVVAEYSLTEARDGGFWINVTIDRKFTDKIGPFTTEAECRRAHDDLLAMTRSLGAVDLPSQPQ
ncbi:MAG: hypothetical protein KGL35_09065 [Bradyrhizobium sp.]|nr:hypothetical protein [Bradyrhizobium sp.]